MRRAGAALYGAGGRGAGQPPPLSNPYIQYTPLRSPPLGAVLAVPSRVPRASRSVASVEGWGRMTPPSHRPTPSHCFVVWEQILVCACARTHT